MGVGEACKAVEGIIDRLIKLLTEHGLRREATAQARIETSIKETELGKEQETLRAMKIANARAILDLRREFHDVPEDLLVALIGSDQDKLIPRIAERKLVGVQRVDGDPAGR